MRHPERVEDYLGHIRQAIERATNYVQPLQDIGAFEQNLQVQDAVVRNIEIIGEAVNHINRMAPEFIAQHPQLPWAEMRDMRNVIIHAYFAVDLQIVWRTVQDDLPRLKQQIDDLLKERQTDLTLAQRFGHNPTRNADTQPEKDSERDHDHEHERE
jgi:uncharacterized protein with HEPN domain